MRAAVGTNISKTHTQMHTHTQKQALNRAAGNSLLLSPCVSSSSFLTTSVSLVTYPLVKPTPLISGTRPDLANQPHQRRDTMRILWPFVDLPECLNCSIITGRIIQNKITKP